MKTLMATVASAALALSLATGGAFAQAAANPLTPNDVPATAPWGTLNIDIAAAGNSPEAITSWANSLTAEQKVEVHNRCQVISDNQATYQADATAFCTAYLAVPGLGVEGAGDAAGAVAPMAPMTPVAPPAR